jgi:hypothetical protein
LYRATALFAVAQTSTSRITGRVVDQQAASIAGASVTITNEATGVSQTQTTTEAASTLSKRFRSATTPSPSNRTVSRKFVKTGNHLEVNNPLTVDIC